MNCSICKAEFWLKTIYKFQKTPELIKKYGVLLDDERNKQLICHTCITEPHRARKIVVWTEEQFRKALGLGEDQPKGKKKTTGRTDGNNM